MKKIIISIFFILVAVTAWSQNLKGYQVEALQMLKAKRAFVIGGDTLFSTTQLSGIDTTFVTLEYLRDSLKITEGQIIDFGDYEQKLNGTGFVKADGTTISYDNTVYKSDNANLNTVNWSVKDATTQYHAVNKGQLDAISTKLGTLSTSFLPYWDGAKLANSHLKTSGSVIQYDSEKVFSSPRDIVDKSYVDAIASGNLPKLHVDAATTSNITLSGLQTIDGYSVTAGQRILVKDQTVASQNGVYIAASGAWTRSADLDSWDELYKAYVAVLSGGQSGSSFVCNIPASGTLETTPITWVLYSAPTNIIPGNGLLRIGNVFSADYGGTGSAFTLSRSDHKHTVSDITNFPAFGTTAGTIAEGNDSRILNGQTAFGWGNHADEGYLTSFDETDPIFTAWDKSYFDLINKPNFKDSISTYQVPTDLSNYTKFTDLDTLSFLRKETDPIWMAQKVDYYTKTQVNGLLPTVNNPTITFAGTAVVGSPQTITLNQSAAKTITLNAPTVPDQLPSDWNATTGVTRILNKPTLFSGSYVDLTNKPTIPTDNNQLTNGAGYITAAEVTTPTLQSVTDAGAITTKAITALNVTISGTPINANHAVRITDLSNALSDYYQKSEVNGLPVSTFTNNAGYLTSETDPIFTAWDKDYNDLINKPAPIVVAGDSINAHVAGLINGTNNNFTTHANFIAGTTMVYVNGVRQEKGFHYNEGGTTQINFISPYTPRTDERIIIDYKY